MARRSDKLFGRTGLRRVPGNPASLAITGQVARCGRKATSQSHARHPHPLRCQHHGRLYAPIEKGAEGGQKREHADDGMIAAPKTLRFVGVLEF